jgi:hypothetical protein
MPDIAEDEGPPLRPVGRCGPDLAELALVPHLELADRLDLRATALRASLAEQRDPVAIGYCVDLIDGLAGGAAAIRALHRGESGGRARMESALRLLGAVPAGWAG